MLRPRGTRDGLERLGPASGVVARSVGLYQSDFWIGSSFDGNVIHLETNAIVFYLSANSHNRAQCLSAIGLTECIIAQHYVSSTLFYLAKMCDAESLWESLRCILCRSDQVNEA